MTPHLAGLLKGGRQGPATGPAFNRLWLLEELRPPGPEGRNPIENRHSRVVGVALHGVEGFPIEVETRISSRLPRVDIVGLPEAAVRESAARVRAAIGSAGLRFPPERVTVNLAPAGLRKGGASLDLPIAVGILAAAGEVPAERLGGVAFVGELSLDGRLRPVRGALALAVAANRSGCVRVVMPDSSAPEAALAPAVEVSSAPSLARVVAHLRGQEELPRAAPVELATPAPPPDLAEVRGQERAKRALEIAAAGAHPLLLSGPPGSGKTMLARRLPGLLPALPFDEALEVTRIHGAAGHLGDGVSLLRERPFRAPHHSASLAGLLGGGPAPRPGEVSLAHRGVLFLDELPEFERRTLESLRQVLEERVVAVVRARGSFLFPADFLFVAAANPCPCGWRGSDRRDCRCDDVVVARYASRISGPLLDRIDLHVAVPAVSWKELESERSGPASGEVRERVCAARALQAERLASFGRRTNAETPDSALDELVAATPDARALVGRAVDRLGMSARGARRVLRVSRTVADLAGERRVSAADVAEALGYRHEGGSS